MAVSLVAAPVIYPWYLMYLTPFLFTRAALPLIAWTYSVLPAYVVWYLSGRGHRWLVPAPVMWAEYGAVAIAAVFVLKKKIRRDTGAIS
jgi:hypothetical protein